MSISNIIETARALAAEIAALPLAEQVSALNGVREILHSVSPFAAEPIDLVLWVEADKVGANDYNPNAVAPPEMRLLELSVKSDGYTQPIVTNPLEDGLEIVDGFHRSRVGKESKAVRKRVHGYLPVTKIKSDRRDRGDRMAATIRHNRARGEHGIAPMSQIVVDLSEQGWDDAKIAKELGMDYDEVLRLKQITGLASLFADREFSKAWE